jgi:hypothetical protein
MLLNNKADKGFARIIKFIDFIKKRAIKPVSQYTL